MKINFIVKCVSCGLEIDQRDPSLKCPKCKSQLVVNYDYEAIKEKAKEIFDGHVSTIWKYRPLLPLIDDRNIVSIGEGGTKILRASKLKSQLGVKELLLKVEAWNPTGSQKDRQLSMSISRGLELGYKVSITSSSGNVGASVAAYSSKASITPLIMVPNIAPEEKLVQIRMYGGIIIMIDTPSNIEVASLVDKVVEKLKIYDVVTAGTHNPYTVEGGRTISYEIFEQLRQLPDVVIAPVGGGGLLGSMWKGFKELEILGLVSRDQLPRMIGVQASGCAPFVRAIRENWSLETVFSKPWGEIKTICNAIADTIPLDALFALPAVRESGGDAIAVSDDETLAAGYQLSSMEGVFAEPSSSTTVAALKKLREEKIIDRDETVLCMITGTGFKDLRSISGIKGRFVKLSPDLDTVLSYINREVLHVK
jgi:threonine synthase